MPKGPTNSRASQISQISRRSNIHASSQSQMGHPNAVSDGSATRGRNRRPQPAQPPPPEVQPLQADEIQNPPQTNSKRSRTTKACDKCWKSKHKVGRLLRIPLIRIVFQTRWPSTNRGVTLLGLRQGRGGLYVHQACASYSVACRRSCSCS
jgi:hypothetical protein